MELTETTTNAAISIKNLLFATDFSDASEAAFPYAIAISRHYGSTLHVAHVVTESAFVMSSGWADPTLIGTVFENERNLAHTKMSGLVKRMECVPHQTWVCTGDFWGAISEVISVNRIDLLVAGTHGRRGVSKLLMGSTAEEILRRAHCPVLTVGPRVSQPSGKMLQEEEHLAPAEIRFQRIVYATDFTPQSLTAKPLAVSLTREFKAELTLLHVIEDHADLTRKPGPIECATRRLEELVSIDENLLFRPRAVVEFGSPAERILEVAAEHHADLIVLGVRPPSYLGVGTHAPWATVPKVVASAHCPVLTVRG